MIVLHVLLIIVLTVCTITDLRSRKIYNHILFPGMLIAASVHYYIGGWSGLAASLLGLLAGMSILIVPYLLGGIGAGDVKLLGFIGAVEGSRFVFYTSLYMAVLGAIMAFFILFIRKGGWQRLQSLIYACYGFMAGVRVPLGISSGISYPYGPAIAGGAILCLILQKP